MRGGEKAEDYWVRGEQLVNKERRETWLVKEEGLRVEEDRETLQCRRREWMRREELRRLGGKCA